jgi:hypothetical protein
VCEDEGDGERGSEGEDGLSLKWVDESENYTKLDYYICNTVRKSCSSLYNITFFFLFLIHDLSTFLFSTFLFLTFYFDIFISIFLFRRFYLQPYSSKSFKRGYIFFDIFISTYLLSTFLPSALFQ